MPAESVTTFKTVLEIFGGLSALTAIVTGLVKATSWAVAKRKACREQRLLETDAFAKSYGSDQLRAAREYYVEPDCASMDPAHEEDLRHVLGTRQPVFAAVDNYLSNAKYRYFLLLADSGMG